MGMSRPLRIGLPDGVYHLTNRGLEPVTALGARFGGVSGQAVSGMVARVAQCFEEHRSLARRTRACENALELDL